MAALPTENRLTVVYWDPFLAYELFKNVSILGYLLLAYPLLHAGTGFHSSSVTVLSLHNRIYF